MDTLYCGAFVYDTASRSFSVRNVLVRDENILAVTDDVQAFANVNRIDCSGLYMIPGLVDVHTHGRIGLDFAERLDLPGETTATSTEERIRANLDRVMLSYAAAGTTSVMVTLASAPFQEWEAAVAAIADYARSPHCGANIPGLHLEGNYLSEKRRGAHAPQLLHDPSVAELNALVAHMDGLAMHISIAPELPGSEEFIRQAIRLGATAGIAHSDATYEQAIDAIRWGASSFTHTYNAMSPLHHRMPGCVGASLLTDDAYSEIICDGFHSHPAAVQLLTRTKPKDKLVLITDSMAAAGYPDGTYSIAGLPVVVKDGKALNSEGAIAGSTICLWDGLCNFMQFTGSTLEEALPAATQNPAQMVGVYDKLGSIEAGKRADLLILTDKTEPVIQTVICGGRILSNS